MSSILDSLETTRVDLNQFVVSRRTGNFQTNPDNIDEVLFHNETDRLVVVSGINKRVDDGRMLEEAYLAEEMLLAIPCVTDLSDMVLVDEEH